MAREIPAYYAIAAVTIALAVVFLVNGTATTQNTAGAAFESPATQQTNPLYLDFDYEYSYEYADLYWESNADTCIAYGDDWSGIREAQGYEAVFPYVTTTYTLECVRESDNSFIQKTVEVEPVDEFYYDDYYYYEEEYDPELDAYY